MTTKPIEKDYFRWLISLVGVDEDIEEGYFLNMLQTLHDREFTWFVPNDDNRIADGAKLRAEFGYNLPPDRGISVLEVLIGISRRLEFHAGGTAYKWAEQLIKNLGLWRKVSNKKLNDILDNLIWRTYAPDGSGGFFPIAYWDDSQPDQTEVEIWYQMHTYILTLEEM